MLVAYGAAGAACGRRPGARRGAPVGPGGSRSPAAVLLIVTALLSPVDRLAEQVFAMHMVQHVLLLDLVPILLMLSLTKVLLRPVTRRLQRRRAGRRSARPPGLRGRPLRRRHVDLARPGAVRRGAGASRRPRVRARLHDERGAVVLVAPALPHPRAHQHRAVRAGRLHARHQAARRLAGHRDHLRARRAVRLLRGRAPGLGLCRRPTTRRWPARSWRSSSRSSWASRWLVSSSRRWPRASARTSAPRGTGPDAD